MHSVCLQVWPRHGYLQGRHGSLSGSDKISVIITSDLPYLCSQQGYLQGFPPTDDVIRKIWLCLPHLVLISQSVIRCLLGHGHHAVMISCMSHWIGLILAPAARQSTDFDAFNTYSHRTWSESLTTSCIVFLFTGMFDACPSAHSST